ncbi:uncharacterized protein DS421_13g435950 [Arachis hypogaea]|nr:uncharacterized protein DS421_13g435950 [Arachis hypogaea]
MASSSFQRNKHSPSSVICFFKIVLRQSLEDGNSVSSFMLITKTSFILSFELQKFPKEFSMKYGDDYPSLDHISDDDSIEILNELPPLGWPRKTEKAA